MGSAETGGQKNGVVAGRLHADHYKSNFADLHPPLTRHEAFVEAERCYFCSDAPCQKACPTSIDIPLFIREIASGNDFGAAKTILNANSLGGMCARVCPTETLCEEACVRETAEGKPVKIGLLQRHATDRLFEAGIQPFKAAQSTGKNIAVVGGGPAGLSCAHKLAQLGHQVTIFEARPKLGGLNEYGIAAYKTTNDFAQREIDFILAVGGITVKTSHALGREIDIAALRRDYDAVFIGTGLAGVNKLGLAGESALKGVRDAVDFIAELRQAKDVSKLPVGRDVVVIGGGMTAIDAAVQSRKLGADHVTIAYRRGQDQMKASAYEQHVAQTHGVTVRSFVKPVALESHQGVVTGVTLEETALHNGQLIDTGQRYSIKADMVLTAIGQLFVPDSLGGADGLDLEAGRIKVDQHRRTSVKGVWAGGDCVAGGNDLTVVAVEDGKQAALSIHQSLMA